MPRGREKETPARAKRESILSILNALNDQREGLPFNALKVRTKLHQDTLSIRSQDLISQGLVEYDKVRRLYKISKKGEEDRYRRWLLELIEKGETYAVAGGPGGGALDPAADLITKSTIGYAFPTINVASIGNITNLVHKYYALRMLYWLAHNHTIDPRCLTGERPLEELVNQLKQAVKPKQQVLAFVIDHKEIVKNLNIDYLKEILRVAEVEDRSGLGIPWKPNYMVKFKQWALELKALEFIQQHGKASLEEIANNIGSTPQETEKVLDDLLERTAAGKIFLKKTVQDSVMYYETAQ